MASKRQYTARVLVEYVWTVSPELVYQDETWGNFSTSVTRKAQMKFSKLWQRFCTQILRIKIIWMNYCCDYLQNLLDNVSIVSYAQMIVSDHIKSNLFPRRKDSFHSANGVSLLDGQSQSLTILKSWQMKRKGEDEPVASPPRELHNGRNFRCLCSL